MTTEDAIEFVCNYQDDMFEDEKEELLHCLCDVAEAADDFVRTELTTHQKILRAKMIRFRDRAESVQARIEQGKKDDCRESYRGMMEGV